MAKKENYKKGFSAHIAWVERKKVEGQTPVRAAAQRDYRIAALQQRLAEGRMTDKNEDELSRLRAEIGR
jgi:uncharacterized protein YgbK (DUF1537 family)